MRRRATLLAALALAAMAAAGCGEEEANEPSGEGPRAATLILDFQPNAVHAGIYAALHRGLYEQQGVELAVREPGASTDAPKLLEAGRAEFGILDIHDLGLARERGLDLVGIAPIIQRPLAAVIAADRFATRRPRDLEGKRVGVTGLPSDEAVLDSVLESDGANPDSVERVTIGFTAVSALAAGRVDAATAFWNAEGVQLTRLGTPTREFRVDDFDAPAYPELVLVTSRELLESDPELVDAVAEATKDGYEVALSTSRGALDDLLAIAKQLDRDEQDAQFRALLDVDAFAPAGVFDRDALAAWARWDAEHGILEEAPEIDDVFRL